ncbi:hypothetical protein GL218_05932 [Daldinia childiae]|uniref:uncharacterized protein n=1 Tax=Daldinia childiae TaxID=326645 RepID=UPI001446F1EB|nr:uncharacterized protein GL218_05932 [Daldinia childiae]KAF3057148.1 hypothetical protein GL218_05932 [Daldinia childiae]
MASNEKLEAIIKDMMAKSHNRFKQMVINIGNMADVGEDDASGIADKFKQEMIQAFGELVDNNMEAITAAMKKQLAGNGSKDETKKQLDAAIPQVRKRPASALKSQERARKSSRRTPRMPPPVSARGYTAQLRPARSKQFIVISDDEDEDEDEVNGGDGVPAKVPGNTPIV